MKILLTGATGFLGRALVSQLCEHPNAFVSAAVRSKGTNLNIETHVVGAIGGDTDWRTALSNKQVVIHAAGRAHVVREQAADTMAEFRRVNVYGTVNLAKQAAAARVGRFIFISSIVVNGNSNTQPFAVDDHPNPADTYAVSKWEAEQALMRVQQETGMEVVIIRPPLVYGPNARGNFGSLVRWIEKGIPLPLGAVHNKRSFVGVDNLVDLIIRCMDHPAAVNQVFLAGDGEDLSTTDFLLCVASAMGRPARLIPVPGGILQIGANVLGKKAMAQRLLGSLQVDISTARELLGWTPPYTLEEGLRRCFEPYS